MSNSKRTEQASLWRLGIGERRALLIFGDLFMSVLALVIALYYWSTGVQQPGPLSFFEFLQARPPFWFYLLPFFWLVLLVETYDPHRASRWPETRAGLAIAALIGMGFYSLFYFTSDPGSLPRRGVAGFALSAWLLTMLWRLVYIRIFTAPQFMRRAVVVGGGATGEALLKVINAILPLPYHLVGVIDDDPKKKGKKVQGHVVLGGNKLLLPLIEREGLTDVLVAVAGRMREDMFGALLEAQEHGMEITRMPVAYEELLDRVPVHHLEADWMLRSFIDETRINRFYQVFKRLIDIVGGLVGVALLILISIFLIPIILLESGRPIFFSQTRAGNGGRPYTIIKFRTMRHDAEEDGSPQLAKEDDERSTPLGRIMRKAHLDEFPQFINVLRGDMSLVGPRPERPELMQHFEELIPFYRARLLAKPGITGWAQINFGYAASLEDMAIKLEYDLYYIKRQSLVLDVVILLRTIATIFGLRGR
ncbi:MAG: exopolysaccharide biosynthesis polyprenyl glycosylphosphotransferase [Chloroflexi bacterium]|nr:exopolysaccharide biosynthesis polyprenyl glycosylphosphotransferase [Chloroflexota bacterium]